MKHPKILIIDDQFGYREDLREIICARCELIDASRAISREQGQSKIAVAAFCSGQERDGDMVTNSFEEIRKAVKAGWSDLLEEVWSLVLLDVIFDSKPTARSEDKYFGEYVRTRLLEEFPNLPIVMLTSKHEAELGIEKIPYLSKTGLDVSSLKRKLVEYGNLTDEQLGNLLQLKEQGILALSPEIKQVFLRAFYCAQSETNVLLLGETGVGKEVIAHYIHNQSSRCNRPIVSVNVSAIPTSLLEPELFGIVKGAATNVITRAGYFEKANGGTLFMDEIGDMPSEMQPKLLRVLQERTLSKLGSKDEVKIDIRLLSATSKNIEEQVLAGQFREDLYYRVNTEIIRIPPLRERREDIIPLAEAFIRLETEKQGKQDIRLSKAAKTLLMEAQLPGNVRQLENIIKALVSRKGNNEVIWDDEISSALSIPYQPSRKPPHVYVNNISNEQLKDESEESQMQKVITTLSLSNLADELRALPVNLNDPSLRGAKSRLEEAFQSLMRRIGGAALEKFRNQRTHEPDRTEAMRFLADDPSLPSNQAPIEIRKMLGEKTSRKAITDEVDRLIEDWKAGPPNS